MASPRAKEGPPRAASVCVGPTRPEANRKAVSRNSPRDMIRSVWTSMIAGRELLKGSLGGKTCVNIDCSGM